MFGTPDELKDELDPERVEADFRAFVRATHILGGIVAETEGEELPPEWEHEDMENAVVLMQEMTQALGAALAITGGDVRGVARDALDHEGDDGSSTIESVETKDRMFQ